MGTSWCYSEVIYLDQSMQGEVERERRALARSRNRKKDHRAAKGYPEVTIIADSKRNMRLPNVIIKANCSSVMTREPL